MVTNVWTLECMTMPPKRTIGGSGDAGAGEAPAQRVKLATEVSVAADEVSRGQQHDLEFIGTVVPPAGAGGLPTRWWRAMAEATTGAWAGSGSNRQGRGRRPAVVLPGPLASPQ